jgi:hypothetical protein
MSGGLGCMEREAEELLVPVLGRDQR